MMWFITCDHDWCSWIGLRCHGPPQWLRPKYAKCWSSFLDVCVFCCKTQMVDGCFFRFFNFHELRIFPASNTIFHGWTTMFQGENTLNNHHLFWDFSDDFLGQKRKQPRWRWMMGRWRRCHLEFCRTWNWAVNHVVFGGFLPSKIDIKPGMIGWYWLYVIE